MARKRNVSSNQLERVRDLSALGYSSTRIQRQLSSEGLGMRRSDLLARIRETKGAKTRPDTARYTPLKYLAPKEYRGQGDNIAAYGTVNGESRRIQMYGSGRELYQAMIAGAFRFAPKKRFLTVAAKAIIDEPERFLSDEEWDAHPEVVS